MASTASPQPEPPPSPPKSVSPRSPSPRGNPQVAPHAPMGPRGSSPRLSGSGLAGESPRAITRATRLADLLCSINVGVNDAVVVASATGFAVNAAQPVQSATMVHIATAPSSDPQQQPSTCAAVDTPLRDIVSALRNDGASTCDRTIRPAEAVATAVKNRKRVELPSGLTPHQCNLRIADVVEFSNAVLQETTRPLSTGDVISHVTKRQPITCLLAADAVEADNTQTPALVVFPTALNSFVHVRIDGTEIGAGLRLHDDLQLSGAEPCILVSVLLREHPTIQPLIEQATAGHSRIITSIDICIETAAAAILTVPPCYCCPYHRS
jgi:hypothetical protein